MLRGNNADGMEFSLLQYSFGKNGRPLRDKVEEGWTLDFTIDESKGTVFSFSLNRLTQDEREGEKAVSKRG